MIAFKIWGLAQALNTIAVCLFLGPGGLIVTPFAIVGGLPALLLFDLLLLWQRRYNHSARTRLIACLCRQPQLPVRLLLHQYWIALTASCFGLPLLPWPPRR